MATTDSPKGRRLSNAARTLHRAIEVAINRGHERVTQEDLIAAEKRYSEDILLETSFEIRDVYPDVKSPLYAFLRTSAVLPADEVGRILADAGYADAAVGDCLRLLVWFGFLGVMGPRYEGPEYAYQVRYNLTKLLEPIRRGEAQFVIHPAFRLALDLT